MAKVKVEGLRELEKALLNLGNRTTAKAVGRRVLKKRAKPIADKASSLAPDDPETGSPDLKSSIIVGTKLNKSQRKSLRGTSKSAVEVHVGTSDPAAVQQEFGNVNHGAQPFMRPAWDSEKGNVLDGIQKDMWAEIEKSAKRIARKAAKGK